MSSEGSSSYYSGPSGSSQSTSGSSSADASEDSKAAETDAVVDDSFELIPDVVANGGLVSSVESGSSLHHRAPSLATRRQFAAHIAQHAYNTNRIKLGQCIDSAVDILHHLQGRSRSWSIYYPRSGSPEPESPSSPSSEQPRLVSRNFQVFNLDLRFSDQSSHSVSSLEQSSVASLLDGRIEQTVKHLLSLRERIDDTASKVLVTGDLNSGKSTFCNALLRRNLLPADQQPCTNVFCEILDFRDNDNIEEVHAILLNMTYDRLDRATYKIFPLSELDQLVGDSETYSILKVFVDDKRPIEQSLLRNGVVDIALIDAPGLNLDSYQTMQLFSRQEEIDLVVFVVSAENHFTLSAKEFISNAAHEKSLVFIVVNRFDNIKDKSRCMRRILDQVAALSPETHKDAQDFVHFVSSKGVVGPDGDDPDDPDDGNGGDGRPNGDPDFDRLEESLRNFVLEKRSLSKLAPAKTYLNNILLDLEVLAEVNIAYTKSQRDQKLKELDDITPDFEKSMSESVKVIEQVDHGIELLSEKMYKNTTDHLNKVLTDTGLVPSVQYTTLFDAYSYAAQIRTAIIERIQDAVTVCENEARRETAVSVNSIKSLGILHIGDRPAFSKVFREDAMFSKKRDALARSIKADLSFTDFFSFSMPFGGLWSYMFDETNTEDEKSVGTVGTVNSALTVASVVGGSQVVLRSSWLKHAFNIVGWFDYQTVRRLAVPVAVVAGVVGTAYVISEIPNSVPKNMSRKVAKEVSNLGYVHGNAERIAKEARKVLKYPAGDLRVEFQRTVDTKLHKREECVKAAREADASFKFFTDLHTQAAEQRAVVDGCNLEALPQVD